MTDATPVWKGAPELEPLLVPLDTLTRLPGNPRLGIVDAVARSYKRFGQRKNISVRTETHDDEEQIVCVAGNHQMDAALQLGWTHVAVGTADDLSYAEARAFAMADNRTSELGDNDDELLLAMLGEVADVDASLLADASYTDEDIAALMAEPGDDDRGLNPDDLDDDELELPDQYAVLVECENENDQTEVYNFLAEEYGATRVRVVTV